MNRTKVKSSNIASVGFDSDTETLEIEFVSKKPDQPGAVYQYEKVSCKTFMSLMTAESIGSYFARNVKGSYKCNKIDSDPAPKKEETHGQEKSTESEGPTEEGNCQTH